MSVDLSLISNVSVDAELQESFLEITSFLSASLALYTCS